MERKEVSMATEEMSHSTDTKQTEADGTYLFLMSITSTSHPIKSLELLLRLTD